eukprot:COSAG05_NODE_1904_length_3853_cov_9.683957_4_plen_248_part_00
MSVFRCAPCSREDLQAGGLEGARTLSQSAMHTREQLLYKLRWSPNLMKLASQVVEGEAKLYNGFTAVKGARGGGKFDLHQDNMYTRHDNGARTSPRTPDGNSDGGLSTCAYSYSRRQTNVRDWAADCAGLGSCGIWVALHDLLTPESGPLLVAVGSHKTGTFPSEDYVTNRSRAADGSFVGSDKTLPQSSPVRESIVVPVRMRRGDICIFSRGTVHGSAPNTSTETRVAYALQYETCHAPPALWPVA